MSVMVDYNTMTGLSLLFVVDPDDPRPLYVQIIDEVRRLIANGTLAPGDPVPSVRTLSASLRLNHLTVHQAYRTMESSGVLEVQRGRGTFVSPSVSVPETRDAALLAVAERALQEASRHGIGAEDFASAISRCIARHASSSNPDVT